VNEFKTIARTHEVWHSGQTRRDCNLAAASSVAVRASQFPLVPQRRTQRNSVAQSRQDREFPVKNLQSG